MEKTAKLSVEQSVRAVVLARLSADPTKILSVSEVCREANVNRTSLYVHHRPLIDELFPCRHSTRREPSKNLKTPKRDDTLRKLKHENKALLYICLELQLEVRSLRARLQQDSSKKR